MLCVWLPEVCPPPAPVGGGLEALPEHVAEEVHQGVRQELSKDPECVRPQGKQATLYCALTVARVSRRQ